MFYRLAAVQQYADHQACQCGKAHRVIRFVVYGCISLACAAFDTVTCFIAKLCQAFFAFSETLFCLFFKFVVFFTRAVSVVSDSVAGFFLKSLNTILGSFEFLLQFGFGFFTLF